MNRSSEHSAIRSYLMNGLPETCCDNTGLVNAKKRKVPRAYGRADESARPLNGPRDDECGLWSAFPVGLLMRQLLSTRPDQRSYDLLSPELTSNCLVWLNAEC